MKKSLIFFGTEDFSAASLTRLLKDGWKFEAVVTKPDSRRGRGRELVEPAVKLLAKKHRIKIFQPADLRDITPQLKSIATEFAVLASYGKIVPQETLDLFAGGIVNVHPSLLPKYRGPAPIEAAILNGDQETGVSLMKLVAQMDAGPVYIQQKVALNGTETQSDLYGRLATLGADFLAEKLEEIIDGSLLPTPQSEDGATYTRIIAKDDGQLDISESAEKLERQVRAYSSWPRCRIEVNGRQLIIIKARVAASADDGYLVIACSPGYLEIERLIVPGGKEMSGEDYIKGYLR